jgi:hypothetical protein
MGGAAGYTAGDESTRKARGMSQITAAYRKSGLIEVNGTAGTVDVTGEQVNKPQTGGDEG